MTASRRPQLSSEGIDTIGFVLRRWRRRADIADFGHQFWRKKIWTLPLTLGKAVFYDRRQNHAGKFIARLIFVPISSTAWCRGEAARWA